MGAALLTTCGSDTTWCLLVILFQELDLGVQLLVEHLWGIKIFLSKKIIFFGSIDPHTQRFL